MASSVFNGLQDGCQSAVGDGGDRKNCSWPPGLASFGKVIGPAYLVAVGYMDPGSWATDLAATPGSWPGDFQESCHSLAAI